MATVKDFIKCPKCGKQKMGKAHPQSFGKEYYAHCCHQYFGVNELVNQWNYDAGDLFPYYPVTHADYKGGFPSGNLNILVSKQRQPTNVQLAPHYAFDTLPPTPFYSEFDGGEPYWDTLAERVDAYEMVNRMLLGIPELDDYIDLKETEYDALGIGVQ